MATQELDLVAARVTIVEQTIQILQPATNNRSPSL